MKKYILGIIIIMAVILVSGCILDSGNDDKQPKTLSKEGISIKYPGNWTVADSKNNETIIAVADPESFDSNTGFGTVSFIIQKRELNSSYKKLYDATYDKLFSNSNYTLIAQGTIKINDFNNASECIYDAKENGTIKHHRAIWIQDNNTLYVILCTAPQNQFNSESKNFDFILDSLKIA